MMVDLGLILILCIVGLGLVGAEVLLPGGILGIFGLVSLAAGVFIAFSSNGFWPGLITTVIVLLLGLAIVMLMFKKLPDMKMSKGLCLDKTLADKDELESTHGIKVGDTGVTFHLLRPSGTADFSGTRLDVVSSGEPIESGVTVKIISIQGARVVVEAI